MGAAHRFDLADGRLQDLSNWLRQNDRRSKPWLLVGRHGEGVLRQQAVQQGFAILSTPDAADAHPADLALVIDVEQLVRRGEAIAKQAAFVAVPSDPHLGGWAAGRPLADYLDEIPSLAALAAEGRLLNFDLWTARDPVAAARGVVGDVFGEEVPLRLLAAAGVKMVRHLGVRSRRYRAHGFEAAHSTLSRSTGGLAEVRRTAKLSYGPYGYPVPARIFAGTDDEQMIGVKVLHYSIEKYSSMDVTVEPLDWRAVPVPLDPKNRSKTGFSFCRFDIPRLCGYEGRGIYVDADMQVFTDITDLWTLPLDDADLLYGLARPGQGRTPQTSVMLMNCESLRWDVGEIVRNLDEGAYSYKALMSDLCVVPPGRAKPLLPYWWNSLEYYEPGRTALLHYTDMNTQPWVSHANPNGERWYQCCAEAIQSGFVDIAEVSDAVDSGHVSPEIFSWLGMPAPRDYREHAATWVPPFNRFLSPKAPEGAVTLTDDNRLLGWAWDPARPDQPIEIGVYDGDALLFAFEGASMAELLKRYGKGDGRHAFSVSLPADVLTSNTPRLFVRTVEQGVELKGSPLELYR